MRKKVFLSVPILIIIGIVVAIIFSPYKKHEGFDYKLIKSAITIHESVDSVFRFLGNSENARKWSVFVDHITPLNTDSIPDGLPGSIRRAYCKADETGMRWDELTTKVEQNKLRQLIVYDFVDFAVTAEGLATEQIYEVVDSNTTKLSFTLFYLNHDPSLWDEFKTHLASYRAEHIFERNMVNIKRIVETGS